MHQLCFKELTPSKFEPPHPTIAYPTPPTWPSPSRRTKRRSGEFPPMRLVRRKRRHGRKQHQVSQLCLGKKDSLPVSGRRCYPFGAGGFSDHEVITELVGATSSAAILSRLSMLGLIWKEQRVQCFPSHFPPPCLLTRRVGISILSFLLLRHTRQNHHGRKGSRTWLLFVQETILSCLSSRHQQNIQNSKGPCLYEGQQKRSNSINLPTNHYVASLLPDQSGSH